MNYWIKVVKKEIEVVAAILEFGGRYLAVQRGQSPLAYVSQKWEFPGGKVEPNETLEQAILRELDEELALAVEPPRFFITVEHSYPDFDITMHCFLCAMHSEQVELKEHISKCWLDKSELMSVDWAPADIPVAQALMSN